ncbi:MAG: hypothetical protein HOH77_19215 [Candidatus Latescibacteria bacterium]|nr:hypothetical protein [Candidatus Latescibacterota bacterium]
MKLTSEAFDRAKTFIQTQARPLEQTLFAFHFENGSQDAVLTELSKFQHDNGGFGHALEPDCRMPDPSPLTTTVAFQIMRDINTPPDHPLIAKGIQYFLDTYDTQYQRWHWTLEAMNEHPRAPWWTHNSDALGEPSFRANPGAEIVGHLWHYSTHVPQDFLTQQTETTLNLLESLPAEMDMHDLLCYLHLLEANNLPDAERIQVGHKLLQAGPAIVTRDPKKWTTYSVKPLWLAPFPTSSLYDDLQNEVELNLNYEIESQNEDGAWHPFWHWDNTYPEAWETAKTEWKGVLTLKTLLSLKAFDRF